MRQRKRVVPALLISLGLLCAPLALFAHSVVNLVEDTEYVTDALEPLIEDPLVQAALVDQALEPLTEAFTSEAVVGLLLETSGLPGPLSDVADALLQPLLDELVAQIDQTTRAVVASDAFAQSWRTAIGDAHRSFGMAVRDGGDIEIGLPLRPFLELIRDDLAASGFSGLERLPIPEVTAPLFSLDPPETWQTSYRVASIADPWLAVIAIGLTGLGVWFSIRRDIAWLVVGVATPLLTVVPMAIAGVFLNGLPDTLPILLARPLLAGPLNTAMIVSFVVVVVAATGWFVDKRRSRSIT